MRFLVIIITSLILAECNDPAVYRLDNAAFILKNVTYDTDDCNSNGMIASNSTIIINGSNYLLPTGSEVGFSSSSSITYFISPLSIPVNIVGSGTIYSASNSLIELSNNLVISFFPACNFNYVISNASFTISSDHIVNLFYNHQIKFAFLAASNFITLDNTLILLSNESLITFHSNNTIESIRIDSSEMPYINVYSSKILLSSEYPIYFYDNNKLEQFFTWKKTPMTNRLYSAFFLGNISFFTNGLLKSGKLFKNASFRSGLHLFSYEENSYIEFYENGNVKSGFVSELTKPRFFKKEIWIKKSGRVTFYENGSIETYEDVDRSYLFDLNGNEMQ